jgi:hypothetical protein
LEIWPFFFYGDPWNIPLVAHWDEFLITTTTFENTWVVEV